MSLAGLCTLQANMSQSCTEQEMQCVLHWFGSWSDMQKADFMTDLLEKAVPQKVSTLFDAMGMLNMTDKPPSIFKCQLKLFGQWFGGWSDKERNDFLLRLEQIDPEFVTKFNQHVANTSRQP